MPRNRVFWSKREIKMLRNIVFALNREVKMPRYSNVAQKTVKISWLDYSFFLVLNLIYVSYYFYFLLQN